MVVSGPEGLSRISMPVGQSGPARRPGWRMTAAIAVLVLASSSCTTVTRTALVPSGLTGGAGASGQPGNGGQTANSSGQTANSSTAGVGGSTVGTASVGTGGRSGTNAGGSTGSSLPGATGSSSQTASSSCHQTVRLGTDYSADEGAALAAVGHPDQATQANNYAAQVKAQRQAMVDYINSTGGLGGCKITLDWYNWSSTNGTGDGESQNECTQLAEDDHDFALIPQLFETPVFVQCAASHGVPVILNNTSANLYPGSADFARYPSYLYAPDYVIWDQLGGEIGQLAQLGFFSSGAKVAILVADDGSGVQPTLVNQYWKPALAKLGIAPVIFTYHHEASVNNVANEETAWSSATLQFKAAGVNRVLFTPDGGDAANFYTTTASSQHFYPRYGLNTYNLPAVWSGVPADQQAGAVAVSFQLTDLYGNTDADNLTAARSNPAQAICNKVYKGKTGSFPVVFAYQWCDALLFLQEALRGAASVSPQTLRAGVERLGTSQPLAGVYGPPDFGPSRHFGANHVQLLTFNASTKNWQYAGAPVPAS